MKPAQIPIEERVKGIEKFLVYIFLAVATLIGLTQNKGYFFGVNFSIFYLIVFFISFPLSIYYIMKIGAIVGGHYGESTDIFLQKYKSKLRIPFFAIVVLISGLSINYLLGKEFKDIIYSISIIII